MTDDGVGQGSSTFQIVRATLSISMMPAGHKAIHDVHVHIIGKSGRSVNLTTNRYIMCRQLVGLGFVVIFSKRPAGHGKGLYGPRVEDPWCREMCEDTHLDRGTHGFNSCFSLFIYSCPTVFVTVLCTGRYNQHKHSRM
jgi:hypothetical protein